MAIPSKGPAQHAREILPNRQPKSDGPAIDNSDEARQQEYIVSQEERQNLSRGLSQRHVQMIAIAGAIGTGLFLGLGGAIATGGPLGALLGYIFVGLIVCCIQYALGEVSALMPVTGSFVRHAELLVDPALAFAIGWNVVYGSFLAVPSEISAAVVLIQYWTDINAAVWVTILIIVSATVAITLVRVYGEIEFFFALLKLLLVVFVVILGLVIDLGGIPGKPRLGFHYWKEGLFVEYIATGAWGRFLGFWAVMTNAVYSFSGVESLAMAAAETKNPRHNIPKACRRVFVRVTVFYLAAVLVVGMLVSSSDPRLQDDSGTAAQSPFVIAASDAGIKAIPSVVNAICITSAWSASNQSMLAGTRTLYGLAVKGHAPKIFLKTSSWGVPYMCVAAQTAVSFLAYMCVSNSALTVFYWLLDLTAAGVLVSWIAIAFNHIRLLQALKAQGIPTTELPWHNRITYFSSWFAFLACILILFTGGFAVFTAGNWDPASFVSSYLDIPLVLLAYGLYKYIRGTKIIPLTEVPVHQALEEARNDPENVPIKPAKGWKRLNVLWA
ncbi:amino acid permease/ SLC12A domain-containing protein [Aspergillus flavus]|uniref:Amino acid permease-associated region n=3 Tax=Aspergillus subgen. Circumdati TaxID=2720871 RepID=A0A1S9DT19_ASPOZ|nr:amino acid transporter [Aspergillus oryzae 3.042]KAB8252969.1 amino acid permease/ SLC12A domain-containing protein [Aspergillus flavus]KDE85164.1 amino acid transporter [Aspergillus oryzae 100-8]OOO12140.1 amino acid permease-associated region [Aspergillus oryzae]|eukprot:EIT74542.1 amino acid transporter [Aspergillus oryzae 3.042]